MIHGFFGMSAEPDLAVAHDAIGRTAGNLRKAF